MNRPDAWNPLCEFTDARIALGRSGVSLPTREVLNFGLAHAKVRNVIHQPSASQQLTVPLAVLGPDALTVRSAVPDRHTYLRRPDLGWQLTNESCADLAVSGTRPVDLLLVTGGGLSSWVVERQVAPLIRALLPYLQTLGIGLAPAVLAHQSRVALGDDIGETLKAHAVAILIGERSGLPSPDSPGVYLTWQSHRQRLESERSCIFNIRPEGLGHDAAAFKLVWLLKQAPSRRVTGVQLKGEGDNPVLHGKIKPLPPLKE